MQFCFWARVGKGGFNTAGSQSPIALESAWALPYVLFSPEFLIRMQKVLLS